MKFLKEAIEQTSRRLKFQEWILLALRCLALILLALALARPDAATAADREKYNQLAAEEEELQQSLRGLVRREELLLEAENVLVAHGAGLKFFLDDLSGTPWANDKIDPELYKRFTGLTKFGVEAYLCEITYKRQNIDMAKTRKDKFLKFVPSGVATVAELQTKGFAYLKVG